MRLYGELSEAEQKRAFAVAQERLLRAIVAGAKCSGEFGRLGMFEHKANSARSTVKIHFLMPNFPRGFQWHS